MAEKVTSDALVAQLQADKVAAGAKSARWENALYGSIGGLIVVLTACAMGSFMNRYKASVSKAAFERELEEDVATINVAMSIWEPEAQKA